MSTYIAEKTPQGIRIVFPTGETFTIKPDDSVERLENLLILAHVAGRQEAAADLAGSEAA